MDDSLEGRTVVVTGGNSGIGLAIARACANAGADVAIWGTNAAKNDSARAELAATGRRVVAQVCDVGDEAAVQAAFAGTLDALGRVDCLFANAGISGLAAVTDLELSEWRRVMRVNLDGAFLTLREAARHMVERGGGGSLVAVSSVSAMHGAPTMAHYASSKAGVLALVRAMAVGLARHGIRCNSLLPGWTKTPMNGPAWAQPNRFLDETTRRTPVRRWAEPDELGPAAVYLANPQHTFHTGDSLVVDGGYTIF